MKIKIVICGMKQNTHLYKTFFAVKRGKEIVSNDRYLNKTKRDSQKLIFFIIISFTIFI